MVYLLNFSLVGYLGEVEIRFYFVEVDNIVLFGVFLLIIIIEFKSWVGFVESKINEVK